MYLFISSNTEHFLHPCFTWGFFFLAIREWKLWKMRVFVVVRDNFFSRFTCGFFFWGPLVVQIIRSNTEYFLHPLLRTDFFVRLGHSWVKSSEDACVYLWQHGILSATWNLSASILYAVPFYKWALVVEKGDMCRVFQHKILSETMLHVVSCFFFFGCPWAKHFGRCMYLFVATWNTASILFAVPFCVVFYGH